MKRVALLLGLLTAGIVAEGLFARDLRAAEPAAVLAPGDNLVVEGLPQIPAALAERASRFTEFRSAALQSWHPQERSMLIGTRFADTPQVHHVASPGAARTQLTFFADRVGGASYHPNSGDYFVLSKDAGGNEFFQFYRYDLANGETTLLTDGKSRNSSGPWSNDGNRIAYGSTRRTGADVDFWVMDPAKAKETDKLLTENKGGGWGVVDWSPDDKTLLAAEYVSINESYLWLVDLASGKKAPFTPRDEKEKVAYPPIGFSKDGKGIYTATDRDSEFMRLTYIDLASKKHTVLVDDIPWDVESAALSDDGKRIAFITNENGISKLRLFDTATKKQTAVEGVPIGVIDGLEWHHNNRDLGFVVASARSPADVFSLDVESGKVDRWTRSETGGRHLEVVRRPRDFGLSLSSAGQIQGSAPRDGDHPRRPGRAIAAWVPGPLQLLH
jgi:Tol biopolymer transport system component